jgi:protoporphyrinogen oxidase
MRVVVIGAGFTGLASAYTLAKSGVDVTVIESQSIPGGLAAGFKDTKWDWPLDQHYHHLFISDSHILNLASEIGHSIKFSRPTSSSLIDGDIYQLDSAESLLKFSKLNLADRLRTGFGLASLKFNPFWQPLEKITAKSYICKMFGQKSWDILWKPLFVSKFGSFSENISAAWFWARIYKRSSKLGYPDGGFQSLANSLVNASKVLGAKFKFNTKVTNIAELLAKYDKVVYTASTQTFSQVSGLPYSQTNNLGAINLVLALKQSFLPNDVYWLNIHNNSMPFTAVVEHTKFIDAAHYKGDNLLYIGNYLLSKHNYFKLTASQLLQIFTPHLKRINPTFSEKMVRKTWVFKNSYAQPIVTTNYSKNIPPLTTSIPNVYLANMEQVYPWDRGTNYAVQLGEKVANLCTST